MRGLKLIHFMILLIFCLTFTFSILLAPYHTEGDQVHYNLAYALLGGLSLGEAFDVYPTVVHTVEPIHLLLIWFASSFGFDKNLFMGFSNSFLAVLFALYLRKKGASLFLMLFVTFSAYYLQAMFFTLERTKFAFIFMLLYLLTHRRWWVLVSVFTHSLMLIPLILNLLGEKLFGLKSKLQIDLFKSFWLKLLELVIGVVFLILLVSSQGEYLYGKFTYYADENSSNSIFEGVELIALCFLTLLTTKYKRKALLFFVGLLFLTIIIGGSRINMIGYFVFLYLSNLKHLAFKFSVIIIGCYLLYKSWTYLTIIYYFGG
jgi:hypothetical protein